MTPGAEIEPGRHWWKASALTTRPTLPPSNERKSVIFLFIMHILLLVNGGSWIIERSIFVRSALVSAHGVKNEVYTCVMRIGLMDQ